MNPKSFIVENNFIRVIKLSNSDERLMVEKVHADFTPFKFLPRVATHFC